MIRVAVTAAIGAVLSGVFGLMLLPILRAHNDNLCALREGVWPGKADEEREIMRRWAQL